LSNKDQAPFDIPDPEAAGWKEDPDRPGYWLWETEQPVTEAPEDGKQYGRQDASWTEIVIPESQWQGGSGGISTNADKVIVGQENTEGAGLYASGGVRAWETSQNNNYLWSGFGGGSLTSQIQADGDAKFSGKVDVTIGVGRYGRASLGFDTNQVFARNDNDLSASGSVDLGTDAIKWKDGWFGGTVTADTAVQAASVSSVASNWACQLEGGDKLVFGRNSINQITADAGGSSFIEFRVNGSRNLLLKPDQTAQFSGALKATSFEGDGSQLTNLPVPDPVDLTGYATQSWVTQQGYTQTTGPFYYYLSTTTACPEKTNHTLKFGRSSSQHITFGGTSSGNWLHSTSDVGNPKNNFYITVGTDNGSTVSQTYTFDSGSLTLASHRNFVTAGNGGWINTSHGGGWHQSDATWIRAYGGKAVYVANNGANAIATAGDVVAYYSDERLKDVQGPIENPLDKVDAIESFYYTHNDLAKSLGYEGDDVQVGVSAQSVKAVMPEVVCRAPVDMDADGGSLSGEDYMTVKYERLVPLLLESIKELRKEIEELKRG
jgi:hypothetical protein